MKRALQFLRCPDSRTDLYETLGPIVLALAAGFCLGYGASP